MSAWRPSSPWSGTRIAFSAGSVVLVVFAVAVQRARGPLGVDTALLGVLREHPGPTGAALVLTQAGSGLIDRVVLLLSLVVAYRCRSARLLLACPVLLLGQELRLALSRVVDRPRPALADRLTSASGLAWPSGHTTSATLGWGLVALLCALMLGARRPARTALLGGSLAGAVVGATRVLLRVHWLTDAVGGVLLGALLLVPAAAVLLSGSRPEGPP